LTSGFSAANSSINSLQQSKNYCKEWSICLAQAAKGRLAPRSSAERVGRGKCWVIETYLGSLVCLSLTLSNILRSLRNSARQPSMVRLLSHKLLYAF
jgi:hypothetical protein